MMQIDCPFCGRRDETEFSYGGEAHLTRPALDVNDEWWVEYLFFRNNVKGVHAERWRHTRGCGQWFNAVRNTATHEFLAFYRATESRPATVAGANTGAAIGPGVASSVTRSSDADAAAASCSDRTPRGTAAASVPPSSGAEVATSMTPPSGVSAEPTATSARAPAATGSH